MANYRAVATGNWSSLAIWQDNSTGSFVASTVLPSVNDDVYTNNFTVTIDQNVTVLSLRNTSATSITAGGRFFLTNGITVTANGTGLVAGAATLIEFNLASPNSATLNYSLLDVTVNNSNVGAVLLSNTGTLNCNGNFRLNGLIGSNIFLISANCTFNLVGNCNAYAGNSSIGFAITAASATINWTGNMPTSWTMANTHQFIGGSTNGTSTSSTLNITGNMYGATAEGVVVRTSGILNFTGNLLWGATQANNIFIGTAASTMTVSGIVNGCNSRVVAISTTGLLTVSGQINCVNESWPISATRLRLRNASTTQVTFQTDVVGTNKTLYEPGTALGNPAVTDVRNGVTYASGALTGTLIVPLPANVRRGVPTDNTIGTADLTAADFWNYLSANATTAGSLGKQIADNLDAQSSLIKAKTDNIPTNPASVQSVGAIVASYNV